ncbi:hypothetical protein HK102_000067 [Quaeritorhiza haematococci]|nr:hypothetical protein HK102_000067 [Quaeritorhiza haematococci]
MLAGSLTGAMGAFSCNPFELVKTRLQSAAAGKIAVGHQHNYKGVLHALKTIVSQDGFTGLYRGSVLSMSRSVVGSGTNLASFTMMKEYLILKAGWKDGWGLDVVAGFGSSIVSVLFMNPIDVTRTRYYNQPYENGKGRLYKNGFDAVRKIFGNEGPRAFYKGLTTHFLRIGPHFCFTFLFLGIFRRHLQHVYDYLDLRDSFATFDTDGDGTLSPREVEAAVVSSLLFIPTPIPSPSTPISYSATKSSSIPSSPSQSPRSPSSVSPASSSAYDTETAQRLTSRILSAADTDKDGAVSWKEYPRMVEEIQKVWVEASGKGGVK